MPSVQKVKNGYRVQICVDRVRRSATFRTVREANAWAAATEHEARQQAKLTPAQRKTLGDALEKYRDEVSPGKRGGPWETIRINLFLRSPSMPVGLKLEDLTPQCLAVWRDTRLKQISAGSVLREMGLMSSILETARKEWQWLAVNPLHDVRRPRAPDHREVIIGPRQIRRLLRELGYSRRHVRSVGQAVAVAFLAALHTGMRAGELCGLTWDRVYDDYCVLLVTKTKPRNVPLTRSARRLIEQMRGWDDTSVFGLKPATLDAMFRKYRDRAGLSGFTFHDSRHTAATRLARRIDVLDLCKAFGWSNTKQALTYYNPSASAIAQRIEAGKFRR